MLPLTDALDNAFPEDLDEIIERALLRYRPILSHVAVGHFRDNLQRAFRINTSFRPWLDQVPRPPAHGVGSLTAGQVALLAGTRPTRVLHHLAHELGLRLDGGDAQSLHHAERVLDPADAAMRSFAAHHVVVPHKGWTATARALRGFVRLGVAAQIAAMLGGLHEHNLLARSRAREEQPALIQRYFLGALEAFGRLALSRKDQDIFRAHYLEAGNFEEIADERDGLAAEVARRRGFLERLATALEAQIDAMSGVAGGQDAPALAGPAEAQPRALTRAAGRAARPRKR